MRRFFLLLALLLPISAYASNTITADSYLLIEKDSLAVISGKDYHRPLPPASTTKVMTTILALEKLNGQEKIVPPRQVLSIPASKLSLCPGREYKAMDLISGAMVESANDAAYTLAVAIAGSEERFADMMNAKAKEIGAYNTHFLNASGLYVPGHYTTAYDLALIFRYALQNPQFQEIATTKYFLFNNGNADIRYRNHNRLLHCFAPSLGGKTGFTRASRHTYVGAFEKDGKVYILSFLGSRNIWGDAVAILQDIFDDVPTLGEIAQARGGSVVISAHGIENASYKTKRGRWVSYRKKVSHKGRRASYKASEVSYKVKTDRKQKRCHTKTSVNKSHKGKRRTHRA